MKILVKNLKFKCIIGLLEKERKKPQRVMLDVVLHVKENDLIVDYASVVKITKKLYKKEKFLTVEDSLVTLSEILKEKFPKIRKQKIKIYKLDILRKCRVGAEFTKIY